MPPKPAAFNGGGGLNSTAPDYIKFMQMILRYGRSGVREEILTAKSVEMMAVNQIGDLGAGKLKNVPAQHLERRGRASRVHRQVGSWVFSSTPRRIPAAARPEAWLGPAYTTRSTGSIRRAGSAP